MTVAIFSVSPRPGVEKPSCVATSTELRPREGEVTAARWFGLEEARAYARPNSLAKGFLLHYLDGTDLDDAS